MSSLQLVTTKPTKSLCLRKFFQHRSCIHLLDRWFSICAHHNDLRDFTVNLLTEVCPNVCMEPPLQALTGELLSHDTSNSEDGAHLDVSAQGLWGDCHHRAFFDVHVFHPNAPSYRKMQLPSAYRLHEHQKQRSYD